MSFRRTIPSTMIALAASCLLILHSLLTGASAGMGAQTAQLDIFGNPLCVSGMEPSGGAPDRPGAALPDCCAHACQGACDPLGHDAAAPMRPDGSATGHCERLRRACRRNARRSLAREPGRPRAPPRSG